MTNLFKRLSNELIIVLPEPFQLRWAELAQVLSLSTYIIFAGAYLQLRHFNLMAWLVAITAGVFTEWLYYKLSELKSRAEKRFRVSAAFISSSALFLLVEVDAYWALAALCAMAIVLKRHIVDDARHHFFNPASLAIIFAIGIAPDLYLFDPTRIPVRQDFFLLVIVLGFTATIMADRWRLTLSYLASFIVASLLLSLVIEPTSLWFRVYRIFAPMNLVFCFHMISDPVTSPQKHRDQIWVGIAIGLTDLFLRELRIYHSTLISMLLIAGWRGFVRILDINLKRIDSADK